MGAPAADDPDAAPNAPIEALDAVAAAALVARFVAFGLFATELFVKGLLTLFAALSAVCSEVESKGIMSQAKRYLRSDLNAMSMSM